MITDTLRITGLATGLDTDEMVSKLMKAENMKVDKLKQNVQLMEWTRSSYRDISNLLRGFKDEYFDVLKPASNMRSTSVFSAFDSSYNGASTSNYLTVNAGASATAGNYSIKEVTTATTAKVTGGALAGGIVGTAISNYSFSSDNNKVTVTFNGASKVITLPTDGSISDINTLKASFQAKLNEEFGTGKITVGNVGNQLKFETSNTNTLSFGYAYNNGHAELLGKDLSSGITLTAENNKFKVTLGTNSQDISLATGTYADTDAVVSAIQGAVDSSFGAGKIRVYNSGDKVALKQIDSAATITTDNGTLANQTITDDILIDDTNNTIQVTLNDGTSKTLTLAQTTYAKKEYLVAAVQTQLDKEFGSGKALVTLDGSNKLRFEAISTETLATAPKENLGIETLGLNSANPSNKINLKSKLADVGDSFSTTLSITADTSDYDIKFKINDVQFEFNSAETSLNDIINQVNNTTDANVKMMYDQLNDRIVLESKQTGVTAKVNVTDDSSNLMQVLGFYDTATSTYKSAEGSDAKVVVDFGDGTDQTIERSTNNFSINGLSFDLKQNYNAAEPLSLNITANPDKAFDTIKGFVEKYNELLDKINEQFSQKRYRDYRPLTEDQKKDMSDKEVEMWEEKAKSGLLNSDPILDRIVNSMRSALYTKVNGVGISLFDIGIKTGTWEQKGKLVIDEQKLKTALKEKPDQVAQLFTQQSDVSYSDVMGDASKYKTRYEGSGLAERLYDIIQDNIRTTRNSSGQKGILLEKAGIERDGTEFDNLINDQIERENDKIDRLLDQLVTKENRYYNMFARMESAIQQMNSQSMWLMQQFGGGM